MILYHGTNKVVEELLPPVKTGNQREDRKGNLEVVFATPQIEIAKAYANTAAKQFGGKPVILQVEGEFKPWKNKPGCSIFIATSAKVVAIKEVINGR